MATAFFAFIGVTGLALATWAIMHRSGPLAGDVLRLSGMAVFALAVLAGAASAQSRKEQADRVVKQYDAPSAACALVSNAEMKTITGRSAYGEPEGTQLTNGGSACDFDEGNVTLFSGSRSAEHYEALLKNFKKDKAPRTPVAGIGDSAYAMVLTSGPTSTPTEHAMLVVRSGQHTVAISLDARKGQTPQSLQPQLVALAKTALAKLR